MDNAKIKQLIKNGENVYVEFKKEINKSFAEEVVSFLNTEGGTILIGVDDNGEVVGINKNLEEIIINICRDSVIPAIYPTYLEQVYEGKKIAIINIERGNNKPYYTISNKYYIRVGSTKRIATKDELLRLFEVSGAFHFDISGTKGTGIKDLNIDEIRDFFMSYNAFDLYEEEKENVKRILINADILKESDNEILCTVGGLLIFGKRPEKNLFQSGISFAHFDGNDVSVSLIDKKEICGRMKDVVDQTMTVIKNNLIISSTIEGALRKDVYEYEDVVLREAIVNALVHRNYSIQGSKIRILLFDDRIEFHSPGRIPNTITIEKMKIGVSYARNPFLVKYMENMRYIDKLGRGIPMIFANAKRLNRKQPKLEMSGEEFILTLYR
ncbi:MAG: putative DNA binding domain-containing protein [Clostridiales bacterium]|nr:putative DNA binding domain-containing protein [Clostridiales bacterium]